MVKATSVLSESDLVLRVTSGTALNSVADKTQSGSEQLRFNKKNLTGWVAVIPTGTSISVYAYSPYSEVSGSDAYSITLMAYQ